MATWWVDSVVEGNSRVSKCMQDNLQAEIDSKKLIVRR